MRPAVSRNSARFAAYSARWTVEDAASLAVALAPAVGPGARVLDVGGGVGRLASLLAAAAGCSATVLDCDPLAIARAASLPGVTAVLGDATAMPFEDASFDGVILVDALHHIAEQGAAVEEIARVTRPGAIVLVAERDPRFVRAWLTCLFERLIGEPATALTPDGVVELFAGAGVPGTCSTRGGDSYRFLGVRDAHLRPHP